MSPPRLASYQEALGWLFRFADWERGIGWNPASAPEERWMLGRPRTLLDLAGAPDRTLRLVLIAGTKGKGSTAAMLDSIARAAGVRTGLYTQPHLHSFRERIQLDGRPIDPASFAGEVTKLVSLVSDLRRVAPEAGDPTTFELATVLALLAFHARRVDLGILEVGLGGRLDATNVVEPLISVITPIGYDHTEILGNSLDQIAREKAGIIRAGGTVISARQPPEARRAILERCLVLGAHCRFVGYPRRARNESGHRPPVRLRMGDAESVDVSLTLRGRHQHLNAAVATAVAVALARFGFRIGPAAVQGGLSRVAWPGRFEVVNSRPRYILDAAHTLESARALARTVRDEGLPEPRWAVLGAFRDKNVAAIAATLAPVVSGIVATAPASRRAMSAPDVAAAARRRGLQVRVADSVAAALGLAADLAGSGGTVVATGSFSVVAEARRALGLPREDP